MLIVEVYVIVKEEFIGAFRDATIENATKSIKEEGIARFDVLQEIENPTNFILLEVYKDESAPKKHKETNHYAKWKETVDGMMAVPRRSVKYNNVFPSDDCW